MKNIGPFPQICSNGSIWGNHGQPSICRSWPSGLHGDAGSLGKCWDKIARVRRGQTDGLKTRVILLQQGSLAKRVMIVIICDYHEFAHIRRAPDTKCCLSEIGSALGDSSVTIATRSKLSCCMWSVVEKISTIYYRRI